MRNFLWGILAVGMLSACSTSRNIVAYKNDAQAAFVQENYSAAVETWKKYIGSSGVEGTTGEDFAQAAKAAYKNGNNELMAEWFDQARYKNYADAEMYKMLASAYKTQGNLSKELTALEFLKNNFQEDDSYTDSRLFEVYFEIEDYQEALGVWNQLKLEEREKRYSDYFHLQRALKDTLVCDSISLKLLKTEPENIAALEWNGRKFYNMGEKRYQREMKKYQDKKTNRQYRILLKELDLATADFKKALTYFDSLWKIGNRENYAAYMANIYARFGDEKKAKYYKGFMKK